MRTFHVAWSYVSFFNNAHIFALCVLLFPCALHELKQNTICLLNAVKQLLCVLTRTHTLPVISEIFHQTLLLFCFVIYMDMGVV